MGRRPKALWSKRIHRFHSFRPLQACRASLGGTGRRPVDWSPKLTADFAEGDSFRRLGLRPKRRAATHAKPRSAVDSQRLSTHPVHGISHFRFRRLSRLDNRESTIDRHGEGGRFSTMPLSGIYSLLSTSPLLCLDYAGRPSGNLCIIQAWGSRLREHRENQSHESAQSADSFSPFTCHPLPFQPFVGRVGWRSFPAATRIRARHGWTEVSAA
jgi:hypothetical protein